MPEVLAAGIGLQMTSISGPVRQRAGMLAKEFSEDRGNAMIKTVILMLLMFPGIAPAIADEMNTDEKAVWALEETYWVNGQIQRYTGLPQSLGRTIRWLARF